MNIQKKISKKARLRSFRIRNKFQSRGLMPRVTVFKSHKHIYAQIIDDNRQETLVSFSSLQKKDMAGDKKNQAHQVGIELGKLASAQHISRIFFDRGRYLYHGRVKALAEGLRESGLLF